MRSAFELAEVSMSSTIFGRSELNARPCNDALAAPMESGNPHGKRLPDPDANTLEELCRFVSSDERKDIVVLDARKLPGGHRVRLTRIYERDFRLRDLLNCSAEDSIDPSLVNTLIDHLLVAESEISSEIAADHERDGVIAPTDNLGAVLRAVSRQVHRRLN